MSGRRVRVSLPLAGFGLLNIFVSMEDELLVLCAVCKVSQRKYCCPRCGTVTCSLECCKKHKRDARCSGKRDAAKYVPSSQMTLKDVRADVSFLEGVDRLSETTKRIRMDSWDAAKLDGPNRKAKHGVKSAAERKRIAQLVMPSGMSRHRQNTSYYDSKSDTLYWRVEWVTKDKRIFEDGVSEKRPLGECEFYSDQVVFLLQRLPGRADNPIFDVLADPDVGLDIYLVDKCVIEHPAVHVVERDRLHQYNVAESAVSLLAL